ncbi:MAG: XkdX family protein [Clostridium sp.]
MWFDTVKYYYDNKMQNYDKEGIKVFVEAEMISAKEYKDITNEDYIA